MATEATESSPMADRASGLIESHFARRMPVKKVRRVIDGLQLHVRGMALFAGERIVNLVVTDQAVRHPGKARKRDRFRFFHAPMASGAGRFGVEMPADIAGRRKVLAGVHGGGDHRREVAEPGMQGMIEMRYGEPGRALDGNFLLVALAA